MTTAGPASSGIDRWLLRTTSADGRLALPAVAELGIGIAAALGAAALLLSGQRAPAALLIVLAAWRGGIAATAADRTGTPFLRGLCAVVNLLGESAVIAATAVWTRSHDDVPGALAVGYLALAAALLLSYARLRIRASAAVDLLDGPGGIASRPLRLLALAVALLVGAPYAGMIAVAAVSHGAVLAHLVRLRATLAG